MVIKSFVAALVGKAARKRAEVADAHLAGIVESSDDAIISKDLEGIVTSWNAGAERIFGYSATEMIGRPVTLLIPPGNPDEESQCIARIKGGERIEHYETICVRKDGRRIDVSLTVLPIKDATGNIIGASKIARDITERKSAEALINGQKQVLEMVATGVPLAESLTALLRLLESQSPDMLCSILLLDADGVHLRHGAAPRLPEEYLRAIDGVVIGASGGSCGTAAFRRKPVIVEDIATDPLWTDYRDAALPHGLRACWSTPIFDAQGRVLGTFAIYYRQPGRPTERHLQLIEIATHIAAIAISQTQAEAVLRESEARYRSLVEVLPVGVFRTNVQGQDIYHNPQWSNIIGMTDEEARGEGWARALHPDDHDWIFNEWRDMVRINGIFQSEYRFVRPGGAIVWVFGHAEPEYGTEGQVVGYVGSITDITERKRAEAALRESEERFSVFMNNTSVPTWMKDSSGNYVYANEAFCNLLGRPLTAILGQNDHDLWPATTAQELTANDRRVLASGQMLETEEHVPDARGQLRVSRVFKFPFRDGSDRQFVGGMAVDITERKLAEQALQDSEQQLREALEQREQLSRDLHDGIVQEIYAIGLGLEEALRLVAEHANRAEKKISDAIASLNGVIREVREHIIGSVPQLLTGQQLRAELTELAKTMRNAHSLRFRFDIDAMAVSRLSDDAAPHVLNITREAISNSLRHSDGHHGLVSLQPYRDGVRLVVEDDGTGFDIKKARVRSQGLRNIEARADRLAAKLHIRSGAGHGTRIVLDIPAGHTDAAV